ncbi:EamA family transporter [Xylophilus rhododendri]|uniref:EamA family transporter n=1 Tax=Xylophilus rhododendri TaxID=2697032 RepID=A0A857J8E8_9BURK|nr:SMR family transporter [Xylophilus rhododendri]QHJ00331.1 EamA family transporter [Xylophilus rhododendri]
MRLADFSWVLAGVLLNALAQLLLKAGANALGRISLDVGPAGALALAWAAARQPAILGGLACYGVSVVLWVVALSRLPVSQAYPMLSIGYVLNALLAWWLFGEQPDAQRWLGIGVIVIGVVLVARSGAST